MLYLIPLFLVSLSNALSGATLAETSFKKLLNGAVDGENVIYIITEKDDTTADSEKKPANPAVIAWIVVAIVVAGAAVAAFFIVKKFTADLPEAEKKDE